jgi:hypothetical protein
VNTFFLLWLWSLLLLLLFLLELTLSKVLGRGGFCVVNEVANIKLMKTLEDPTTGTSSSNLKNKHSREDDEHHIYNIVHSWSCTVYAGKGKIVDMLLKKYKVNNETVSVSCSSIKNHENNVIMLLQVLEVIFHPI